MSRALPRCEVSLETMAAAGCGALSCEAGNLPLVGLDVRCRIDALACRTIVKQVFHNSHDEFVEATYIFPLPGRFAVTECKMFVGERAIVAELQERSQSRANYDRAIASGRRAAIAEEERSETFNLRVGNIPPGREVSVELTLVGMLSVVEGEAALRIPLVVAPRYVAGSPLDGPSVGAGVSPDTDEAPDASRVTPPTLLPGFPNPVALSVEVEIDLAGLACDGWREAMRSSLHSVFVGDGQPCIVRLMPGERVDRDFLLRFPILPRAVQSLLEYSPPPANNAAGAGVFAVTIAPPAKPTGHARPRDVIFVLDRSGSMSGWKIAAARRAVARMIGSLRDDDRFRLMAFDDRVETHGQTADWLAATDRNRWRAAEWIAHIDSRGGTELAGALQAALRPLATFGMPASRDTMVVLITDGQVAGEDSVLRSITGLNLGRLPRIFTLGVDRAVNASLLTRLAELGGGLFELVESETRLDAVMERFHREIGSPVLKGVTIEPLDFDLVSNSLTPPKAVDLFADRPLTIYGRVAGNRETLRLRVAGQLADGSVDGAVWSQELTARCNESATHLPLWGRGRVRDLEDRLACGESPELASQIVAVSLESHVLSRYTAYVAVDLAEVANPTGAVHRIVQPVEAPEGWQFASPRPLARMKMSKSAPRGMYRDPAPPMQGVLSQPSDKEAEIACDLIPESVARENSVVPVEERDGRLVVRMSDPNDLETIDKLSFILNQPIEAVPGSAGDIAAAINEKYGEDGGGLYCSAEPMLQEFTDTAIDFTETTSDFDEESDEHAAPIVRLVQLIVAEATQFRATHVYLSPQADRIPIVYVIDGSPHERGFLSRRLLMAIVRRLQLLAKIDPGLALSRLQSGEMQISVGDVSQRIRVYIVPTTEGPSLVLRLLNQACAAIHANELAKASASWLSAAQQARGDDPESRETYRRLLLDSRAAAAGPPHSSPPNT